MFKTAKTLFLVGLLVLAILALFPVPTSAGTVKLYSESTIVTKGTELTNHTLSHASDDSWYNISAIREGPNYKIDVEMTYSTSVDPSAFSQIYVFSEAHVQDASKPVAINIWNSTGWELAFNVNATTDTAYSHTITANLTNYINATTGEMRLQVYYLVKLVNQSISQDHTYIELTPLPPGWITGKVTDALTDLPIEGAIVTADGYFNITDAEGFYSIELPAGTYDVTASAEGYFDKTQTGIVVSSGATTTQNIFLPQSGTIEGYVKDYDWPYAPIYNALVEADTVGSDTTDATGYYRITGLTVNTTYSVTASHLAYISDTKSVNVPSNFPVRQDFSLKLATVDLNVTNVVANVTQVCWDFGRIVQVNVTVNNEGWLPATDFNVSAWYDGSLIDSEYVGASQSVTEIAGKSSHTFTFNWNTTSVPPGNYTIKGNATQATQETNMANNEYIDGTVFVKKVDIAITNIVASPSPVHRGTNVTINVTVENQGNVNHTFSLGLSVYNSTHTVFSENRTGIFLANGTSKVETFTWNTTGLSAGFYTIKAEVPPDPCENDTQDNTDSRPILVKATDISVEDAYTDRTIVFQGEPVNITVRIRNWDIFQIWLVDVIVWAGPIMVETRSVQLEPAEEKTETFTWDTTGVEPAEYEIKVEILPIPEDENPLNNVFIDGIVTVVMPSGTLTVSTTPVPGAIYVDGEFKATGNWSGVVPVGNYTISFGPVTGYTTPANQTAEVFTDLETVITGIYEQAHDVAVYLPIALNATEAYPGWKVSINVTVGNEGLVAETFWVAVYYNRTATEWVMIDNQTITLPADANETLTFIWDMTDVPPSVVEHNYTVYTIKAEAGAVPDEIDVEDNVKVDGAVKVKWPGDATGDGFVELSDFAILGGAWYKRYGEEGYDPSADFNGDGFVELSDFAILGEHWYEQI